MSSVFVRSVMNSIIGNRSLHARLRAMNSDSIVELAMDICILLVQRMGQLQSVMT